MPSTPAMYARRNLEPRDFREHVREKTVLQCLRDGTLVRVQPAVLLGECFGLPAAARETLDQPDGRSGEEQSQSGQHARQACEQRAAELFVRGHHDEQLRIAERHGDRCAPAVEERAAGARCQQLGLVRRGTQIERVPEVGEGGVGVDGRTPVLRERSLRIHDVPGVGCGACDTRSPAGDRMPRTSCAASDSFSRRRGRARSRSAREVPRRARVARRRRREDAARPAERATATRRQRADAWERR